MRSFLQVLFYDQFCLTNKFCGLDQFWMARVPLEWTLNC
ncbi:hypothetical protein MITS9509_00699 [Synechococcus sp. MIT S9509]|nr:hypothetical protein MITS9504_00323 [Synechococcus sp. MIT S9504]KZR93404.1 hypothetical protein MITS9509_00699 [Synechococcus sp. MIT S9509]